ncbi:MAG: glycosyltransferase family 2 protein [Paracoccus sp. (in: a-proteobacteria)]
MNKSFLLSVVITNRNRAAPLLRAVLSLLDQTHEPVEIIVVDDCSSNDLSAGYALLESLGVTIVQQDQHRRGPAARNRGAREARGTHISFLDSDDIWLPGRYKEIREFYSQPENSNAVLVSGAALHVAGEIHFTSQPHWRRGSSLMDYVYRDAARIQTSMLTMPAEIARRHPFDEDLRVNQDTDLVMRLDHAGIGFAISNTPGLVKEETPNDQRLTMDCTTAAHSYEWYRRVARNCPAATRNGYHLQDRVWRLANSGQRSKAIFCLLHTLLPAISLRETARQALCITIGEYRYAQIRRHYRKLGKDNGKTEICSKILARWNRLDRSAKLLCSYAWSDSPEPQPQTMSSGIWQNIQHTLQEVRPLSVLHT